MIFYRQEIVDDINNQGRSEKFCQAHSFKLLAVNDKYNSSWRNGNFSRNDEHTRHARKVITICYLN